MTTTALFQIEGDFVYSYLIQTISGTLFLVWDCTPVPAVEALTANAANELSKTILKPKTKNKKNEK